MSIGILYISVYLVSCLSHLLNFTKSIANCNAAVLPLFLIAGTEGL